MKYTALLFFFLINLVPSVSQFEELSLPFEQYRLPNGLEVVLQPDPQVKEVSVEFWLRDGIALDQPDAFGMAHFFEHVLPFEPRDSVTSLQFKNWYSNSNAQVKKDYSRFYLEFQPAGLELGLKVASGRFSIGAKGIDSARVEYQRERVLAEIGRAAKNPTWSAPGGMAIDQGTFGTDHPYGHNGYGTIAFNEQFSLEDFRGRYEEVVYANNTILFVVGNFQVKEAKLLIEQYFSKIPQKTSKNIKMPRPRQRAQQLTMQAPSPEEEDNTLILSWAIPAWSHKHYNTLDLAIPILNNRMTQKKDWPLSLHKIEAQIEGYKSAGKFYIRADFKNKGDSLLIRSQILQEMEQFSKETPSVSELEEAQQQVIDQLKEKQERLGFQTSRTELLGESLLFTKDPNYYFLKLEQQQNIAPNTIRKVFKKHLQEAPFSILFLQNKNP